MKPRTKVIVIIATVCMALGLAFTATAFALADFDVRNLSTSSPSVEKDYLAKDTAFTEVRFEGLSENVLVKSTSEDSFSIDYYENEYLSFEITEDDDVLRVVEAHKPMIMVFNFSMEFDRMVVINVPESYTGSLNITSASGTINVQNFADLESITARSTSGNVVADNLTDMGSIHLESTSNRINATNIYANQISFSNMSGDVVLENIGAGEDLSTETVSGAIHVSNIAANRVYLSTGSDDISGTSISANSVITNSTSGDIIVDLVEAEQIAADNASGRISYSIIGKASDYYLTATSVSGNIEAPQGTNGASKTANLSTISGDIYLEFTG